MTEASASVCLILATALKTNSKINRDLTVNKWAQARKTCFQRNTLQVQNGSLFCEDILAVTSHLATRYSSFLKRNSRNVWVARKT